MARVERGMVHLAGARWLRAQRRVWVAALLLAWPAGRAMAFSDFNRYGDPTSDGGTDGRYFTGSPMDGYGCNACHQGAEGIQVSVSGLPEDSYEPGASYEVTVRFEHPEPHAAMVLEFVDEGQRPAGTISPPSFPDDINLIPTEEFCMEEGMITGPALNPITSDDGRNLIAVPDCGARAVRFIWMAPSTAMGAVWMAAGVVSSDERADPTGDGVTLVRRPLLTGRASEYARELASGCAVAPGAGHRMGAGPWAALAAWLATGAVAVRRRRPRDT